ncbi:angio-associated migratory cell protein isoform X2 [Gracilaria domingensis]|nr:angio-associated migratory cell protein isoform X2 [Gracilaria domingensis]
MTVMSGALLARRRRACAPLGRRRLLIGASAAAPICAASVRALPPTFVEPAPRAPRPAPRAAAAANVQRRAAAAAAGRAQRARVRGRRRRVGRAHGARRLRVLVLGGRRPAVPARHQLGRARHRAGRAGAAAVRHRRGRRRRQVRVRHALGRGVHLGHAVPHVHGVVPRRRARRRARHRHGVAPARPRAGRRHRLGPPLPVGPRRGRAALPAARAQRRRRRRALDRARPPAGVGRRLRRAAARVEPAQRQQPRRCVRRHRALHARQVALARHRLPRHAARHVARRRHGAPDGSVLLSVLKPESQCGVFASMNAHHAPVRCVRFAPLDSPRPLRSASAAADGSVHLFDMDRRLPMGKFSHGSSAVVQLEFSHHADVLFSAAAHTVMAWDARVAPEESPPITFGTHDHAVNAFALVNSGANLVTACDDGMLRTYDMRYPSGDPPPLPPPTDEKSRA